MAHFTKSTSARLIPRPGARAASTRDKAEGRRLVLATASYRLYADALAERLGFDDVIGTGSGASSWRCDPHHCAITGRASMPGTVGGSPVSRGQPSRV